MVRKLSRLTILSCLLVILAATISGCGAAEPKTALTGATVTQSNHFSSADTGTNHTKHIALTITPPAIPPAAGASTQPSAVNIDGKSLLAPPGTAISYVVDETTHETPAVTTEENVANATGVSIQTNGDKGDVDGKPPTVAINPVSITGPNGTGSKGGGGKSSGGETDFGWTEIVANVSAASSTAHWMMGAIAIAMLIGYGVAGFLSWETGKIEWAMFAIITGAGVLLMGIAVTLDTHPDLFVLAAIVTVGAALWYAYHRISSPSTTATATVTTTASGTTTAMPTATATSPTLASEIAAEIAKVEAEAKSLVTPKPATPPATPNV